MKYKYSRKQLLKYIDTISDLQATQIIKSILKERLIIKKEEDLGQDLFALATKPEKEIKPIEKINMATYQGNRDTAIEIMVENKLNELIDRVNSLIQSIK